MAIITTEILFLAASLGFTLEQLNNVGDGTLEGLPASLDSPIWQGSANAIFAAFDASHALTYFNGANLPVTIDTSETQLVEGKRARVRRVLPIVDGGAPSILPGTRARQQDSVVFGKASIMNADGYCPLNAEGRYHRFRITLASGSSFQHVKGVDVPQESMSATGTR